MYYKIYEQSNIITYLIIYKRKSPEILDSYIKKIVSYTLN